MLWSNDFWIHVSHLKSVIAISAPDRIFICYFNQEINIKKINHCFWDLKYFFKNEYRQHTNLTWKRVMKILLLYNTFKQLKYANNVTIVDLGSSANFIPNCNFLLMCTPGETQGNGSSTPGSLAHSGRPGFSSWLMIAAWLHLWCWWEPGKWTRSLEMGNLCLSLCLSKILSK